MIQRIQNTDPKIAKEIFDVFQASYAVEAKLLNAKDFPPLKRTQENFIKSKTAFYGWHLNQKLTGVIEIAHNPGFTHVNSLVVNPKFFKKGIASELLRFVFNHYRSNLFVVETGIKNIPACTLYKKFDFIEVNQWDTDHGVRKVKFEKTGFTS